MYREIANGSTPVAVVLMVATADGTTAVTGITPAVEVSKNGGAFAAATNSVSEIANGWYKVTLTATETNTNGPLIVRATGTGALEWRDVGLVVAATPDVNVVETVETYDDASAFSVGFWDGTTHRAIAVTDDDAATTTVSKSHASAALLSVPSANGSDNISATVDSVTHSTFVLNYAGVDSTARKSSILLIEGVATGLDDIDYLQPGIQTGTVPGMP